MMQILRKLENKIFLLVGRAILTAIDNSMKTQKVQMQPLANETISDQERFQEYGLETYPLAGAEVAAVFLNGNREQGITICVHDRRYRPLDLSSGDVAAYTNSDGGTGLHRIHLKSSGKEIDVQGDLVKLGKKASTQKTICLSDLVDSINDLISKYNTHTHIVKVTTTCGAGAGIGSGIAEATAATETPFVKANLVTAEVQAS